MLNWYNFSLTSFFAWGKWHENLITRIYLYSTPLKEWVLHEGYVGCVFSDERNKTSPSLLKASATFFYVKTLYLCWSSLFPESFQQQQILQRHPYSTSLNTENQPSRPASKKITLNLSQLVSSYQRLNWGKCIYGRLSKRLTFNLHLFVVLVLSQPPAPEDLNYFLCLLLLSQRITFVNSHANLYSQFYQGVIIIKSTMQNISLDSHSRTLIQKPLLESFCVFIYLFWWHWGLKPGCHTS